MAKNLKSSQEIGKTEEKTLYAALPVHLADVEQGLHPLTQPGREILFFDTQDAAVKHALTSKLEGATRVAFTCTVTGLDGINPTNANPEAVGARTLPRNAAGTLTMTVIDDKGSVASVDVTNTHLNAIMSLARLAREGLSADQFPSFARAMNQHERTHDAINMARMMQQEPLKTDRTSRFVGQVLAGTGKQAAELQEDEPTSDNPTDVGDGDVGDYFGDI